MRHLAEIRLPGDSLKSHRNLSDVQFESDLFGAGSPRKRESRSQRGMSGKRQFFLHREDSDSNAALALGLGSRGKMKVVSERFISLAIDCISESLRLRARLKILPVNCPRADLT